MIPHSLRLLAEHAASASISDNWTQVLTIAGVLLGGVLTGAFGLITQRATSRATLVQSRRDEQYRFGRLVFANAEMLLKSWAKLRGQLGTPPRTPELRTKLETEAFDYLTSFWANYGTFRLVGPRDLVAVAERVATIVEKADDETLSNEQFSTLKQSLESELASVAPLWIKAKLSI